MGDQSQTHQVAELAITWSEAGTYSELHKPLRLVIRDPAGLAAIPVAEVPVDFQRQMVLVAALGVVPTEGYAIRITRVWRDRRRVYVDVRVSHPQSGGEPPKHALCAPYHIVVVPRSDLNVEGFSTRLPSDPRGHNPYK
jgi:hypothetical protein